MILMVTWNFTSGSGDVGRAWYLACLRAGSVRIVGRIVPAGQEAAPAAASSGDVDAGHLAAAGGVSARGGCHGFRLAVHFFSRIILCADRRAAALGTRAPAAGRNGGAPAARRLGRLDPRWPWHGSSARPRGGPVGWVRPAEAAGRGGPE